MLKIKDVVAREVYDSRSNPTVECDLMLDDGSAGRFSVPSGASTGEKAAHELRDGGKRLEGKGTKRAAENINTEIKKEILGKNTDQNQIDKLLIDLDGTKNKKRLGANAILAVSVALLKANASSLSLPLYKHIEKLAGTKSGQYDFPYPLFNLINGGKHATNNLDFQEFLIVPMGAKSFSEAVEIGAEIFKTLKSILLANKLTASVGDEGGFAPDLRNNEEAISLVTKSIKEAGYRPGGDVFIALDVAANSFYDKKEKLYQFRSQYKKRDRDKMIKHFSELSKKYPIFSIEDPLYEGDDEGWVEITKTLGARLQIVGDDYTVTNPDLIQKAARLGAANTVIIKPNQVGTVTETLEAIKVAKDHGYDCITSHRSGDTEDSFIADLAFGTKSKQIKSGSLSRSERVAKYNQLLRIEEDRMEERELSSFKQSVFK